MDDHTYVIGRRIVPHPTDPTKKYLDTGIVAEPAFRSFDVVMNPETREFYSSKPPLMPTLLAGEYWLLKGVFHWDIFRDRWLVIPPIVFTVNVAPVAG